MYRMGRKVVLDLFGRSHAGYVGCILSGLPAGMPVDLDAVRADVELRKPSAGIGTPRVESDRVEVIGGITGGRTDGNPLLIRIANRDTDSSKYLAFRATPRPGHADLPALVRDPRHDIRGGGQFSGRLTVALVAAGSICGQFNKSYGIRTSAHTRSVGNVSDGDVRDLEASLDSRRFRTRACTEGLDRAMAAEILAAGADGDSIGGVVECITEGLPIGFGDIWFDALDALLAKAMFGIPACKGVEFGAGFGLTSMRGSESNDPFRYEDGIRIRGRNMGGILGGMSDGSPLVFRTAFKPTPSISKEQDTVNLEELRDDTVKVTGRHDPCIVPRAAIVVEAMTALVLADQIVCEGALR